MGIGGNTIGTIEICTAEVNEYGEQIKTWEPVQRIVGWLDLPGSTSNPAGSGLYTAYDAKIRESTDLYLSDYQKLDERITDENSRMVINNKRYDIVMIDDPMGMHRQLEFFLKYVGGQNTESDAGGDADGNGI